MNLKYIKWLRINFILLVLGVIFNFACNKDIFSNNRNQIATNQKTVATPSVTPFQIPANTVVLGVDEKMDKNYHESEYRNKLKIIFVLNELTKLNSIYVSEFPPDDEFEKRKKKIFKLVDDLGDDADGLFTLAEMCQIMSKHTVMGLSKITSSYDIAFFYSVKVVALKHKNDESITKELMGLMKKHIFGGHTAADFLLSLDGKEPRYLYHEEPTPEEFEYLRKQFEYLEKKTLE